ncbi:unnamed protein product [Prorocentrum cordatum]|uniref:Subtilisin n=1 Tax=Prorocentrum cordatum TaxID=2364126 RepID=A0ABN9R8P3_9DINO|nr:unnamed protein product [Polarella glacialis]
MQYVGTSSATSVRGLCVLPGWAQLDATSTATIARRSTTIRKWGPSSTLRTDEILSDSADIEQCASMACGTLSRSRGVGRGAEECAPGTCCLSWHPKLARARTI